jgi:hypothetical protein
LSDAAPSARATASTASRKSAEEPAINCKSIFTVYVKKLGDSLPDRRRLILTLVILTIVMPVMLLGMGKIMSKVVTTAREEDRLVMVGLWPIYGIGPLHFTFVQ